MPGTKFRKWEEEGVRVRVEIGPKDVKDADRMTCVVAIAKGVGEVADKATVGLGEGEALFDRRGVVGWVNGWGGEWERAGGEWMRDGVGRGGWMEEGVVDGRGEGWGG